MRQVDMSPACSRAPRRGVRCRFVDKLSTGCQQTNLCDEVNPGNRHVAALKIGVPSPPVARDYELIVNCGNVGKLCKRHRLSVSQARQWISSLMHSLFGVRGGRCARVSIVNSILFNNNERGWRAVDAGEGVDNHR